MYLAIKLFWFWSDSDLIQKWVHSPADAPAEFTLAEIWPAHLRASVGLTCCSGSTDFSTFCLLLLSEIIQVQPRHDGQQIVWELKHELQSQRG